MSTNSLFETFPAKNQTTKPKCQEQGHSDNFQTPAYALLPLVRHLNKSHVIWECAAGKGYLATGLIEHGFDVTRSDVLDGPAYDFRKWQPPLWDCIVTNPPFSLKNEFLARAFQLDKPFAMLLPYNALATHNRQKMFREKQIEVIMFPWRINFETPNMVKDSKSWFDTMWLTYKLNIGNPLYFDDSCTKMVKKIKKEMRYVQKIL